MPHLSIEVTGAEGDGYRTHKPTNLSIPINTRLVGLPATPRSARQMLYPIDTAMSLKSPSEKHSSYTPSPYGTPREIPSRQVFVDPRAHSPESMIFANATIPLSPTSSNRSSSSEGRALSGLTPRKRNGFARLFCCFGREERARRRIARETDFKKVGDASHWSEY
jgi:hypothetical protein